MPTPRAFWLVKTEPDCFSIHNLAEQPKQTTCWSGVRNYQARNFMQAMKQGDRVLFYHSSADPPAVAGVAIVAREAYPDPTAWDEKDDHFDPKASPANPIWQMVDIQLETIFPEALPIGELRGVPELAEMELLKKGSRLSVQPVRPREFEAVLRLAKSAKKSDKAAAKGKPSTVKASGAKTTKKAKPAARVKSTGAANRK